MFHILNFSGQTLTGEQSKNILQDKYGSRTDGISIEEHSYPVTANTDLPAVISGIHRDIFEGKKNAWREQDYAILLPENVSLACRIYRFIRLFWPTIVDDARLIRTYDAYRAASGSDTWSFGNKTRRVSMKPFPVVNFSSFVMTDKQKESLQNKLGEEIREWRFPINIPFLNAAASTITNFKWSGRALVSRDYKAYNLDITLRLREAHVEVFGGTTANWRNGGYAFIMPQDAPTAVIVLEMIVASGVMKRLPMMIVDVVDEDASIVQAIEADRSLFDDVES